MRNVTPEQVAMAEQHRRGELPDRIEGALGELAGAAKEGLMALSVGVGLGVLHELMAARSRGRRPEGCRQVHHDPHAARTDHADRW